VGVAEVVAAVVAVAVVAAAVDVTADAVVVAAEDAVAAPAVPQLGPPLLTNTLTRSPLRSNESTSLTAS